jgi:hypothetical protein
LKILYSYMNSSKNKKRLITLKAQDSEAYPDYVIKKVQESLKQADKGELIPYISIKDMLHLA